VSFTAEHNASVVTEDFLDDVAALVILIFFPSNGGPRYWVGNIVEAISLHSVSCNFQQLAWAFNRTALFDADSCGFNLDTPDGAQETVLFLGAIQDLQSRTYL